MRDPTPTSALGLVTLLVRRWPTILLCMILGGAGTVAYALLAPPWYEATLTVMPTERSQQSLAASLASKLPVDIDTGSTDIARVQAVMTSISVADEVIDKFDLMKEYDTQYRELARVELAKHCVTTVNRKASMLAMVCEDKDPKRAMEMATFFGEVGNRVFGRISVSSAREERRFLETQVVKARTDVDESSKKLREFQETHKIVDLGEQSKAVISAMASIKGELLSKQLDLSYLEKFSSANESSVVQLQQQIKILQAKLASLELAEKVSLDAPAAGSDGITADFFPGAMRVPELRYQLEQLMRDQKVQETVFAMMTQRFEMSKIDEARDTPTMQILDMPTLPTMRSRPKRRKLVMLGLLASIALAGAVILLPYLRGASRPQPPVA